MTSTQAVAFDLAAAGAADGTVVVAEHQTAGRGRRGHVWEDEPGQSLLLSIVVRPRLALAQWPLLGFAAAVAVAEALESTAGLGCRLKWPNDVLVGGRKIAGILVESRTGGPVIVGIGINVGQTRFSPPLAGLATSVLLETGRRCDRAGLLHVLLSRFEDWRRRLETEGFAPVRQRWLAFDDTIGRRVRAEGVEGRVTGLDEDGALMLQAGTTVHRLVAGPIEAVEPD